MHQKKYKARKFNKLRKINLQKDAIFDEKTQLFEQKTQKSRSIFDEKTQFFEQNTQFFGYPIL